MSSEPFQLVIGNSENAVVGWVWDEPYLMATGSSEPEVKECLLQKLDDVLLRRSKVATELKPPSSISPGGRFETLVRSRFDKVASIQDRITRDEQRRQLPVMTRTIEEWHAQFPVRVPLNLLIPRESHELLLRARIDQWAEKISKSDFSDALNLIPDSRQFLPVSNFPERHCLLSEEDLREILLVPPAIEAVELVVTEIATRKLNADPKAYIARHVCCGLGEPVSKFAVEFEERRQGHRYNGNVVTYSTGAQVLPCLDQFGPSPRAAT